MPNPYVNKVVYGNETIIDLTGDDVLPADVRQGVHFHGADGAPKVGTSSGGGGGEFTIYPSATEPSAAQNGDIWIDYSGDLVAKNFQISSDPVNTTSTTLTETAMAITVTKTGIYNVYACVGYNRNSGTAQFLVKKNGTTDIIATTNISTTTGNCGKALNVSLNAGDVLKVWLKSASSSYRAFATALIITEV